MEREDITDELLIAFADGELTEPELKDVAKLISEHKDLRDTVEKQKALSADLRDFFDVSSEKTPDHIADKIREMAAIKSSSNVVEISAFRKFSERANISLKSLSQMVAALAIGVYFGPSVLDQLNGPQVYDPENTYIQPLKLRSADGNNTGSESYPMSQLQYQASIIQGKNRIFSGGAIEPNKLFKISIVPPFSGEVSIFEIKNNGDSSIILEAIQIEKGEELWLPKDDAFEISDQTEFLMKVVFKGSDSSLEQSLSFKVSK
jgi:hypothetical protein